MSEKDRVNHGNSVVGGDEGTSGTRCRNRQRQRLSGDESTYATNSGAGDELVDPFDAVPRAVVVRSHGRERVRLCSAAAWAMGVRPGMPSAEARALAPSLVVAPNDPAADRAELVRWAGWCEQFSPLVGIASPDDESLLLDITGLDHLFGSERALAEQLAEGLRRHRLYAQLAIADTVGAAFAAAHSAAMPPSVAKPHSIVEFTSRRRANPTGAAALAGRWAKVRQRQGGACATAPLLSRAPPRRGPHGSTARGKASCAGDQREPLPPPTLPLVVLPPGDATVLGSLSISALRLPDEAVSLLLRLGIERVGALAALPRYEVSRRLGAEIVLRLEQVLGERPEPIAACRAAEIPRACWDADDRWLTTRDEVVAACERLLRPLAERLSRQGRGALRVFCRLECIGAGQGGGGAPPRHGVSLAVGLFAPGASAAQWLGLLSLQCERLSLPGPVARVEVSIPLTAPLVSQQALLWGDRTIDDVPRGGAALIERLCSRLGGRAVFGVRLTNEPLPENAWRAAALTALRRDDANNVVGGRAAGAAALAKTIPPRPLSLFSAPQPVAHVVCGPDGLPRRFQYGGRWQVIVAGAGPERIVTGWWRGPAAARDYYRVQTASGGRYWLFRSRHRRWYVHGRFD